MTHRNICPICGSENPEGSEFCQVCKANLQALPSEMFPSDPDPIEQEQSRETQAETAEISESELDNPVPVWLKSKLKPTENKMDFDTYTNMLFGVTDSGTGRSNSNAKPSKSQRAKKSSQVYQPPLQQSLIEPPLLEPDEGNAKFVPEDVPGIADFLLQRPARKWEYRKPQPAAHQSSSISLLTDFNKERPARKWDDHEPADKKNTAAASQPLLWWQQDNPLVEAEDDEISKGSEADDPALLNSVSPTKVMDDPEILRTGAEENINENDSAAQTTAETDNFEPESGSLLSDLMNEMNSSSVPLTPSEQQENQDGTVFYSGNHPADEPGQDQKEDIAEISISDDSASNAEMLDRILRNIGYEVEGEAKPETSVQENKIQNDTAQAQTEEPENNKEKSGNEEKASSDTPLRGFFIPQVIDNPLIPSDDEDPEEKDADPYGLMDEYIPEKEDSPDEQDIPWDLFGSADMALPQSPEDPEYRTFSRSSLPEDPGSTDYQQRMISSILGKIIQAENFVEPAKEKNERKISLWARIFLSVLAVCGVVFILQSGFTDRFDLPETPVSAESEQFYSNAEAASGDVLVVVDYTPAFHFVMDDAAENLISTLDTHANTVYLAALNPAVMPSMQQKFNGSGENTVFAGWWPSGVISIRSRISSGEIPNEVWLLTTESSSVRNWAEQLSVSGSNHKLHVMAPEQLKPILSPYRNAGMITSALCDENDLLDYGAGSHITDRTQIAVWYLAALVPAAWVCGLIGKMMKAEPKYGRKSTVKSEEPQLNTEKETAND